MPTRKKPYRGSWDPFEDIVSKLDKLGAPYVLLAAQEGLEFSVVWSNLEHYENQSIEAAKEALESHLDGCMEK